MPEERKIQDYRSTYNDIQNWLRKERGVNEKGKFTIDWDDVIFEVELLKSQEINLDYILEQIFEKSKKVKDQNALIENVQPMIRASIDLDKIGDKASVIEIFFTFAQKAQVREAEDLIKTEALNCEAAKRYIATSLKREFVSDNGTDLYDILPKMSP